MHLLLSGADVSGVIFLRKNTQITRDGAERRGVSAAASHLFVRRHSCVCLTFFRARYISGSIFAFVFLFQLQYWMHIYSS